MEITDTSEETSLTYSRQTRQGSTMVPRVLFFVNEQPNPATVRVGNTITTSPRRGVYDKEPWKSLDLPALNGNTVENEHLFDVHLGETLVPYATLTPLKAILPIKSGARRLNTILNATWSRGQFDGASDAEQMEWDQSGLGG